MLNFAKEEFYLIDYDEFDKMVNDFYGCICSEFAADQEANNDSCHEFNVEKKEVDYFVRYQKEDLDEHIAIKKGEIKNPYLYATGGFMVDNYLCDMARLKHIPFGRYLIRVCW